MVLLAAAGALWAQAPGRLSPAQRYELFQKHLAIRSAAITRDPLGGATNLDEWKSGVLSSSGNSGTCLAWIRYRRARR